MAEKENKMTYEQMEKLNAYLAKENQNLQNVLKANQLQEVMVRLNCCFKVLELAKHFSKEYVKQCADEVQRILVMENPNEDSVEKVLDAEADSAPVAVEEVPVNA